MRDVQKKVEWALVVCHILNTRMSGLDIKDFHSFQQGYLAALLLEDRLPTTPNLEEIAKDLRAIVDLINDQEEYRKIREQCASLTETILMIDRGERDGKI